MPNTSAFALTAFIAWTLLLHILMAAMRTRCLITRAVAASEFSPDNTNLPPFMQGLARVHTQITARLALWWLHARVI